MKRISRKTILFSAVAVALIILAASFFATVRFYADWLFFEEVGFESVFTTTLTAKGAAGIAFFSVAFIVFYINFFFANRPDFTRSIISSIDDRMHPFGKIDIDRTVRRISLFGVFLASIFSFLAGTGFWKEAVLFLNSKPAGIADPIFGKDISFYLFTYPFVGIINQAMGQVLIMGALFTALIYFFRGGISYFEGILTIDARTKRHLGILVSLFIVNLAFTFYLDRYALLFREHGVLYGASYADIHARLLMLNLMTVVAAVCSIGFFASLKGKSKYMPLTIIGVLGGAYLLGLNVYPSMLQSFKVSPNEIILERPYIENHIKFTRFGYGLEKIQSEPFDASESLAFPAVRRNLSTIRNIRLWDEDPLLKTYSQLQQIRTYYRFIDVDNDRYTVNGRYMQVMLSPREISSEDLPGRSWINERLVYTHGFGISMGPVSGITREGLPEFIVKDIPPVSAGDLRVKRPEIYYGENPNDYVVVRTNLKEFSYPTTEGNVYTTYEGSGGIKLSSFFRRLFYAMHFGNFKLFLSGDITSGSRIIYYRNIMKRVEAIAPFLLYDADPYMVVSDEGRLFWIIDAYSYTNKLPYSKPVKSGINYIRNPVKVVVDAYNGAVSFYVVDSDDILVQTYRKVFPSLFMPLENMPADIRKHIRYPQSFLRVQAQMFNTFHMTDPNVFYNKEDLWEIPQYKEKAMDPYYLIMKLPKGTNEEFVLLLPFTPSKRDNLAAWMAARCDGDDYGKVVVYTFPRDRLVFGPRQIDARIDQDAYISQQLTLWGQRGSDVIRGSLLIIPIENSLIYVQPLYLVATDRVGLPELRRVIVAFGNEVVMEETLDAAIQRLVKGALPETGTLKTAENAGRNAVAGGIGARALQSLKKARESLRKEDWSGFGRYLKETEDLLREMKR